MMWRALLASIPMMDAKPHHGLRQSYRGVINYRIASNFREIEWCVDIYRNDWYVVTVRNFTVPCPSVPSAIGHLRRMLGLQAPK